MNSEIRLILEAVKRGELSVDDAALKIKVKPFEDIGYAKVDLHRKVRQGAAEVIYGAGKNAEQISGIASAMRGSGQDVVLITRLSSEKAEQIKAVHPLAYHAEAGIGVIGELPAPDGIGRIVVATGGTSDIPVAEEASLTAEVLGNRVTRLYDVGVAGLHRLLAHLDDIKLYCIVGHAEIPSVLEFEGGNAEIVPFGAFRFAYADTFPKPPDIPSMSRKQRAPHYRRFSIRFASWSRPTIWRS